MNRIHMLVSAAVAAVLAFGVNAAIATPAAAGSMVYCPGYVNSAQICNDCCWNNYGAYGAWDSRTRYCNCAL
jgi:hypothetical protein